MRKFKLKPGEFGPYFDDNGKLLGHMYCPYPAKNPVKVGTVVHPSKMLAYGAPYVKDRNVFFGKVK